MPIYDKRALEYEARKFGFRRDTFEKVVRLKDILNYINNTDFLNNHLVLKGGTAINLTVFDLPRLSVDIDMDYMPNDTKEEMSKTREAIKNNLFPYMESEGYVLSLDSRYMHSLDGFHFQYVNAGGNKDTIKIEINYSLRAHILESVSTKIMPRIFDDEIHVQTLNPIELFAAKANALLNRAAPRDLYDFGNMIDAGILEDSRELFRKCIIFYSSISAIELNKEFNTSQIDTIDFNKVKRELFPVIEVKANFDLDGLKRKAKEYIAGLMILTENEKMYLDEFERKNYRPELLFDDSRIIERIQKHPMALWKCR